MNDTSDNFRGAALMTASMAGYVLNDATVRLVATDLNLFQVMFLRGLFATSVLGLIAWHRKSLLPTITRADWRLILSRIVGEVGATLCFLTALFNMPIANASAILQALPLAVTLGAAVFLGEPVGWRRYLAIIVGFVGVIIIVRPGSENFSAYSLWALAAVAFIVLRDLTTRQLSPHVPSIFVAFVASLFITLTGAVLSPTLAWQPVNANHLGLLGLAALFLIFGYLFSIMTMRVGEVSFISPFRYTSLIWSIVLGFLVFGEIPDEWTIIGSAIVVLMGIYTFYRERRIQKLEQLARA